MGTICLQRDAYDFLGGPKEELIYCFRCMLLGVRHSDAVPKTKDGTFLNWLCDQCESETGDNRFENNALPGSRAGVTNPGLFREETPPVSFAEPLIRSVWSGMFNMLSHDDKPTLWVMYDVQAFLSSKACKKVHEAAALFRPALRLQMEPRENVWPKGFIDAGPTDDNIALYFFSSPEEQESHDRLVYEMLCDDLAMRAFVGDAELLIFTSAVLPAQFWRHQGRLFLWGVFRGRQAVVDVC